MCRRFETVERCPDCKLIKHFKIGFHKRCDQDCLSPPRKFTTVLDRKACEDRLKKPELKQQAAEEKQKKKDDTQAAKKKAKADAKKEKKENKERKKAEREGRTGYDMSVQIGRPGN